MDKEKKFVSLIVYLHNNENEIKNFFETTVSKIADKFSQFELICVDDACEDNTLSIIAECVHAIASETMVNVVHMSYYQGLEASMNAGRDLAIGDFVYEFDTCFVDYEMDVLDRIYEKLLEGYDVVSAASDAKSPFTSRLFYRIYNASVTEKACKIGPETLRIISRRAINRVKSMGTYIPYRKAVYANCGLKNCSLTYTSIVRRRDGKKTAERMGLAFDSFIYFTDALEKLSKGLCVFFLLTTVFIGVYILSDVILRHNTADGWLSIMGFLSVGFFGMFLLFTVVLKYLSSIINLVFKQKRYVISDIEKITSKGNNGR